MTYITMTALFWTEVIILRHAIFELYLFCAIMQATRLFFFCVLVMSNLLVFVRMS